MRSVTLAGAAFVLIICLAGCVTFPAPLEQLVTGSDAAFPGGSLTVVTLNILHGFAGGASEATLEDRLEGLASALAELHPDIAILQEVSLTPENKHGSMADRILAELNAATGETWSLAAAMAHGSPLIGFYEGSAILSRYQIVSSETLAYRAQSLFPPERRIALRILIRGAEVPIEVISTHLTNQGQRIRDAQAKELADRFLRNREGKGPLFIGGDFNARPRAAAVDQLIAAGAVDVWAEAGTAEGYTSLEGEVDDPAARLTGRIDYLFAAGEGVEINSVELFADAPLSAQAGRDGAVLWISDHAGVVGRFEVGEGGQQP